MRWGLRHQLLVPPLLLLLAVAGITTWTALSAANRARQQLERRVHQIAEGLTEKNAPRFPLNDTVLKLLQYFTGAELIQVGEDGRILGESKLRPRPEDLPTAHANPDDVRLDARIQVDGTWYLCGGIRVRENDLEKRLYVLYPEALWRDALWQAVRPSLLIGGVLGLAAVIVAVAVGQRLTRRFQELERRTRLIAAGDFSPMPLPHRHDEIRDLTASVNDMAEKLARLQETVQKTERLRLLGQVSGGLAHQLRNGVAGARLAIQLHRQELVEVDSLDPSAVDVALRQLTLVETNLKRFLDLGRRELGQVQPCSLTSLVGEAVLLVSPQCQHAQTTLTWTPPDDDMTIQGDVGQLQQLFLNVLVNAVEAAGPGGKVEVILQALADRFVLEISDSGPGPSPQVAARLFEPFVTGKPEGVGLGLAVARQVAEGHNGSIRWERRQDHTVFHIELRGVVQ